MTDPKLFHDKELFQEKRPKMLTNQQHYDFISQWAKEAESYIQDLDSDEIKMWLDENFRELDCNSGYELARMLDDDYHVSCIRASDISSQFVDWLGSLELDIRKANNHNVNQWVKAHNITPMYEVGQVVTLRENNVRKYGKGDQVYITGIRIHTAEYVVNKELKQRGYGTVFTFEQIEPLK